MQKRAEKAWSIRNKARVKARSMMADATEVDLLRARDIAKFGSRDGPTFAWLVERLGRAGLVGDAVYEAIVDQSHRTDAESNRDFGL